MRTEMSSPMPDIEAEKVRSHVQDLTELPAASPLVASLLEAVGNDDITIREFAALIRQEPSLVARIIGLANSAYFGHAEPITSVEDAIFKSLGLQLTKSLALSIALVGSLGSHLETRCFDMYRFWSTSVLSATLARMLSPHVTVTPRPGSDDAYLAGMLHNFGMLPLAFLYPEAIDAVCKVATDGDDFARRMHESLGTDQYEVGVLLARKWQIPDQVVAVIGHVREPDYDGAHRPLVQLLHGVTRVVHVLKSEEVPAEPVNEASLYAPLEALGIEPLRIRNSIEGLQQKEAALDAMVQVLAG